MWESNKHRQPTMEDFRFHPFIYLCGIPLVFAALLLRRVWRLCNVPGPFLSHFTDLLRVYHQARGNLLPWLTSIHEQYGTVVRIGPNCVSVSDPRAVPSIYTMHGEFRKVLTSQHSRARSLLMHFLGRLIPLASSLVQRCLQRLSDRYARREAKRRHEARPARCLRRQECPRL